MLEDVKDQGASADLGNEVTATTTIEAAVAASDSATDTGDGAVAPKELSLREMELMSPAELEKLLAADPAAAEGQAPAEGAGDNATPAPAAGADSVAAGSKVDGIMIPKARLDEVLEQKRRAEEELAFYKGKTEGMKEAGVKPEPTVDPRQAIGEFDAALTKLDAKFKEERDKIADQFEAGKLSEKQKLHAYDRLELQRDSIEQKIIQGRNALIEQLNTPSPEQLLQDPDLIEASQKLYADEPWILNLPASAVKKLKDLTESAYREKGTPLKATVEDVWRLRAGMAAIGKEIGMDLKYGTKPGATAANDQTKGGQQAAAKNPLPTPAQVAAKLNLAAKVPPAPGAAGTTAATITSDLQKIEDNVKDSSAWEMGMNHSKEFFQKALGV